MEHTNVVIVLFRNSNAHEWHNKPNAKVANWFPFSTVQSSARISIILVVSGLEIVSRLQSLRDTLTRVTYECMHLHSMYKLGIQFILVHVCMFSS